MKKTNYISSQISPTNTISAYAPNPSSTQHCFLQDFTMRFSIALRNQELKDHPFFEVTPANDNLNTLLNFNGYNSFVNDLDKLFSTIMYDFIFYGQSFIEIVLLHNNNQELKGIALKHITCNVSINMGKHLFFVSKLLNDKYKSFTIDKRFIIKFSLKDLGYSRYYLKQMYKKLQQYDITNAIKLTNTKGFDWNTYHNQRDFSLLKKTKHLFWYGRHTSNVYLSESYLLYRAAKFKNLQKEFLIYILKQINNKLHEHKTELGFNGELIANYIDTDFLKELNEYSLGRINTSQLCKKVFNTTP